ncbi:MAG: PLP-dependent aminotransferase family protein [Verrucomicrobiota bacterium]|nr:PLP-dependent aminotransferase family protein [Verrucomicrobiota bacterium]
MEVLPFTDLLATRTGHMGASAIREILKVVSQPGMVSLAGGIPAPESFPMDIMEELATKVIRKYQSGAFQYDLTEGFVPLREALVGYLLTKGITAIAADIMITSGSQGVLDGLGKILIDKGDAVVVEAPTYLGALQAFNPYEPTYLAADTDDDGIIPESLEAIVSKTKVKFVYLVPNFQNPTGRTIPLERRKAIASIIQRHNVLLIEDDPYGDLRYRGQALPPIKTFAPDHVVYSGTVSKVFAPGLRIGFFVAPAVIKRWMVIAKQGVDLHSSTFAQALATEYITGGYLERQIPKIIALYRPKQEAMLEALTRHFPTSCHWAQPEGGMFIWVKGPEGLDMEPIYWKAIERKAAFVPGKYFFSRKGEGIETMRLNFTMATPETIDRGVKVIGDVIREAL